MIHRKLIRLTCSWIISQALSVSHGIAKILFSGGKPLGDVNLVLKQLLIPKETGPFKNHAKEDAVVYRIPGDILFAFNKYHLKPGSRTENALAGIGYSLHMTPEYRFLVIGHTDSIGSNEYNMTLSKQRAETVASWLKAHNFAQPAWIKAIGVGKSEPIASNATEEGRAQSRHPHEALGVLSVRSALPPCVGCHWRLLWAASALRFTWKGKTQRTKAPAQQAVQADTDKRRVFGLRRFPASLIVCRSSRRLSVRLNRCVRPLAYLCAFSNQSSFYFDLKGECYELLVKNFNLFPYPIIQSKSG